MTDYSWQNLLMRGNKSCCALVNAWYDVLLPKFYKQGGDQAEDGASFGLQK